MIRARIKLFFHCLLKLHRSWSVRCDGKRTNFGCVDCQASYWGEVPSVLREFGWIK